MDLNRDELRRELKAIDADNRAAMPRWYDALRQIVGGDTKMSTDEKAALLGVPSPSRRTFFKVGGVTIMGAAVLARTIERGSGEPRFPPAVPDDDLVNALAQYLPLDPLERQALLECDGIAARCRALIDSTARRTTSRSSAMSGISRVKRTARAAKSTDARNTVGTAAWKRRGRKQTSSIGSRRHRGSSVTGIP